MRIPAPLRPCLGSETHRSLPHAKGAKFRASETSTDQGVRRDRQVAPTYDGIGAVLTSKRSGTGPPDLEKLIMPPSRSLAGRHGDSLDALVGRDLLTRYAERTTQRRRRLFRSG